MAPQDTETCTPTSCPAPHGNEGESSAPDAAGDRVPTADRSTPVSPPPPTPDTAEDQYHTPTAGPSTPLAPPPPPTAPDAPGYHTPTPGPSTPPSPSPPGPNDSNGRKGKSTAKKGSPGPERHGPPCYGCLNKALTGRGNKGKCFTKKNARADDRDCFDCSDGRHCVTL